MTKISKILNIVTYVMITVTVVLLGLFYFGGEIPNQAYTTPVYTQELLVWAYILFAISAGAAIIFPLVRFVMNPKDAMKGIIAMAGLVLVILIAYSMSDATLLNLPGYTGSDNTPGKLMFADTILYTMYFLGIGTLVAILVTEIIRKLR